MIVNYQSELGLPDYREEGCPKIISDASIKNDPVMKHKSFKNDVTASAFLNVLMHHLPV
ncbi:MAG: hypothetical protein WCP85_31675 [Mariniphaga sp.]